MVPHYLTLRNTAKSSLAVIVVSLIWLFTLLVNPFSIATGMGNSNPYSAIQDAMNKGPRGKLLYISSYDDFYNLEVKNNLRREMGERFSERGQQEILGAASLGEDFFVSYLNSMGVTYLLVPLVSAERGEIRHKWGALGSIRIQLSKPYFRAIVGTAGDHPVVLFEVESRETNLNDSMRSPSYSLKWSPKIRPSFYGLTRTVAEDGLYSYKYQKGYEDGLDVSWVYQYPRGIDGLPDISETAEFQFHRKTPDLPRVDAKVTLVAAYGPLAPPQVIRVVHNGESVAYTVSAGKSAEVILKLGNLDVVRFENVLPCRQPQTFQPGQQDWRKFCFGISDIQIRLVD